MSNIFRILECLANTRNDVNISTKMNKGYIPLNVNRLNLARFSSMLNSIRDITGIDLYNSSCDLFSDKRLNILIDTMKLSTWFLYKDLGKDPYKDSISDIIMEKPLEYSTIISHMISMYELDELDFTQKTPEVAFCKRHNIRFTTLSDVVNCGRKTKLPLSINPFRPVVFSTYINKLKALEVITDELVCIRKMKIDPISNTISDTNVHYIDNGNNNHTFMVILKPVLMNEEYGELDMKLYDFIRGDANES